MDGKLPLKRYAPVPAPVRVKVKTAERVVSSLLAEPRYYPGALDAGAALMLFESLRGLPWGEGIRTRFGGTTRKALQVPRDHPLFDILMIHMLPLILVHNIIKPESILGLYLNYYEDGNMYTPSHRHRGTNQLVLSLGGTRNLMVEGKSYPQHAGDMIYFGDQLHGVPKQRGAGARISVATFADPASSA